MRIILGLSVIVSFSICYMEWSGGNKAFLAEAEYEILFKQKNFLHSLFHPLILSGVTGQLLILYYALISNKRLWLLITGTLILSVVPAMILLSAILSMNIKMSLSVIPFIISSIINLRYNKKRQKREQHYFDA